MIRCKSFILLFSNPVVNNSKALGYGQTIIRLCARDYYNRIWEYQYKTIPTKQLTSEKVFFYLLHSVPQNYFISCSLWSYVCISLSTPAHPLKIKYFMSFLLLLYIGFPRPAHHPKVREDASKHCRDHPSPEDNATPSQMDYQWSRP